MRNKVILITGAGTLAKELAKEILKHRPKAIRIITRSQESLEKFPIKDKRIRLWQKDVKELNSLIKCFSGVDYVIHTAAEKRINYCEQNPEESFRINVEGTLNVCFAAAINKVKRVLFISTDKAFEPLTYYGYTKAMAEQLTLSYNNETNKGTRYSAVRYGNVYGSSGSVIELWREQEIKKITDYKMTRFFMMPDTAVKLVIYALKNMKGGELFCYKMKSIEMGKLLKGLYPHHAKLRIGLRGKEKVHEGLYEGYYSWGTKLEYRDFVKELAEKFDKRRVVKV